MQVEIEYLFQAYLKAVIDPKSRTEDSRVFNVIQQYKVSWVHPERGEQTEYRLSYRDANCIAATWKEQGKEVKVELIHGHKILSVC